MEQWQDQGIVLAARAHGENGAVVSVLTQGRGRHAGYVHGARSSKMRGLLEPGTFVEAHWSSRDAEGLGTFRLEQTGSAAAGVLGDPLRLSALLSACALCDEALPEREGHPGLYDGLKALMDILGEGEVWPAAYIMWELALLRELGFGLDLSACAGGGDPARLAYVSPKTGRAVSLEMGALYKDRLLKLPGFLRPSGSFTPLPASPLGRGEGNVAESPSPCKGGGLRRGVEEPTEMDADPDDDILTGLRLTGYFLEHRVFAQHTRGVPEARLAFEARYNRLCNAAAPLDTGRASG